MDLMPESGELPVEMDEVIKLLEAYEKSGRGFGDMPDELQDLLNNVKKSKGQPTEDTETEDITPEPGFVIKTTDQDSKKVFINICHSQQVPAPGGWTSSSMPDKVLKALEDLQRDQPMADAEALRFPLSCSELQPDTDKQGQPCSTIDCIIHSDVLKAAQQHRPLKAFLIELALDWVGSKHKLELNPKFKLPKMTYKGDQVRPQRVRLDRKPLVTDVTTQHLQDEEPSFPLMPSKPAPKAASKAAAAAAGHKKVAAATGPTEKQQSPGPGGAGKVSSAAAAGASSGNVGNGVSSSSSWQSEVKCEGKPVTHMVVTMQLPQTSSSSNSSWSAADITVEVCGPQLRVTAAGQSQQNQQTCVVQLPFAASAAGAEAQLLASKEQLVVQLPYLPLQQWVQQLAEQSPHAFAKLPVAHAAYMELDDVE